MGDARRLLGRPHHLSLHPGGVVITPGPIEDYVPLEWAAKGVVVTQFEKDAIERVGLVKIDLLGNRALATVDEAKRWAAVNSPPPLRGRVGVGGRRSFTPHPTLPRKGGGSMREMKRRCELLQRGDTMGVNQLESPAMRHLLIQMRPRNVEDVVQRWR